MKRGQNNNIVGGDMSGGSMTKNYYETVDLIKELKDLSDVVNSKLPIGVFVTYENRFVQYCSKLLFSSLIEISIPLEVTMHIVREVPNKIDYEIKKNNELEIEEFTTNNIQNIVFNILKRLDYGKYGKKIEIWGENYIRKYGIGELKVLIDAEHRFAILDRKFIEKEILPKLYEKCYNSDLNEDIQLIQSKSVLSKISNEILEKVRLLNLYQIRYQTLFNLSYDLAIQPPHHWFTDKVFREKHLEYNLNASRKHYSDFINEIDIEYSSKEFIEHSSAVILSFYTLFIGLGKLRPLVSLLEYLKQKEKSKIFWETSELSNFQADINATGVPTNFSNFKIILDKIKLKLNNVRENKDSLKTNFLTVLNVVEGLVKIQKEVNDFNIKTRTIVELKNKSLFLFKFFDNIKVKNQEYLIRQFKNNLFQNKLYSNIKLLFIYEDENDFQFINPSNIENSNSIFVISNNKIPGNIIKSILKDRDLLDEYIFYLTINEIYKIVKSKNRCDFLEHSLNANSI